MKLIREFIMLAFLLIFLIVALMINLSFFSHLSIQKSVEQNEIAIKQEPKPIKNQKGKQIFKNNCAACHNRNMQDGLIGPALGGVRERWKDNDATIYNFIRNSQAVIKSSDSYARDLFAKWKTSMPPFLNLKDEEIKAILDYIDEIYYR